VPLISGFKGIKYVCDGERGLAEWLREYVGEKGSLDKSICVSQMALEAALRFGCDPVVFLGQDFAYAIDTGLSHVEGTDFSGSVVLTREVMTGRELIMLKDNHFGVIYREAVCVDAVGGGRIYTDTVMQGYITLYERIVKSTKATVVQASEGGARIHGTREMSLREVLDTWCTRQHDVAAVLKAERPAVFTAADEERLINGLDGLAKTLGRLAETASRGEVMVNELLAIFRDNLSPSARELELKQQVNDITDELTALMSPVVLRILEQQSVANTYLFTRSQNLRNDNLSGRDQDYRFLERVAIFYSGVRCAARDIGALITEVEMKRRTEVTHELE
jgi:hypothetical protein